MRSNGRFTYGLWFDEARLLRAVRDGKSSIRARPAGVLAHKPLTPRRIAQSAEEKSPQRRGWRAHAKTPAVSLGPARLAIGGKQ